MHLKKISLAFLLTLVLATSALAGGMECPLTSPTPDPTATTQGSDTTTSTSTTTGDATSSADAAAAAALSLVGTVLALF